MEKKVDVLYAEDDDKMAGVVKKLLEDNEFHVRIACDGRRAWDIFQRSIPDLLLLDLEMPRISEALFRLLSVASRTRRI